MAKIDLEAIMPELSRSADAWIWQGWLAESPESCTNALNRALEIDPDNEVALAGLIWAEHLLDWEPESVTQECNSDADREQLERQTDSEEQLIVDVIDGLPASEDETDAEAFRAEDAEENQLSFDSDDCDAGFDESTTDEQVATPNSDEVMGQFDSEIERSSGSDDEPAQELGSADEEDDDTAVLEDGVSAESADEPQTEVEAAVADVEQAEFAGDAEAVETAFEDQSSIERTQQLSGIDFGPIDAIDVEATPAETFSEEPNVATGAAEEVSEDVLAESNDGPQAVDTEEAPEGNSARGLEAEILGQMNDLIEETESRFEVEELEGETAAISETTEGDEPAELFDRPESTETVEPGVEIEAQQQDDQPVAESENTSAESSDANFDEGGNSGDADRPLILAVDDSPTVRKLVSMTLERVGYEVTTAADGVAALNLLAERLPVLILSDINMPRITGYKLCKLVKKHERTRHIPVLMLSGKNGVFDKVRGQMVGCADYITKPFESHDLIDKVRQYALQTTETA
ncbi:MAG: response regulator [Planctomycetota bacterium]